MPEILLIFTRRHLLKCYIPIFSFSSALNVITLFLFVGGEMNILFIFISLWFQYIMNTFTVWGWYTDIFPFSVEVCGIKPSTRTMGKSFTSTSGPTTKVGVVFLHLSEQIRQHLERTGKGKSWTLSGHCLTPVQSLGRSLCQDSVGRSLRTTSGGKLFTSAKKTYYLWTERKRGRGRNWEPTETRAFRECKNPLCSEKLSLAFTFWRLPPTLAAFSWGNLFM